jgi:hypothetical protein
MKTDAQIIEGLGGPAKVAELLGFKSEIGTQRVHNWKVRGIPAAVRLKHLDIFSASSDDATNPAKDAN